MTMRGEKLVCPAPHQSLRVLIGSLFLCFFIFCFPDRAFPSGALDKADADFQQAIENWGDGQSVENERLLEEALAIRKRELEPGNPQVAQILERLGALHYNRGDYEAAEKEFGTALKIEIKTFGEDDLHSALLMGDLAAALREHGKYSEAEPIVKRELVIRRKLLPPNDPVIAASLNNLARLYFAERRYAEARAAAEESLFISQMASPPSVAMVAKQQQLLEHIQKVEAAYRKLLKSIVYGGIGMLVSLALMTICTLRVEKRVAVGIPREASDFWSGMGILSVIGFYVSVGVFSVFALDWVLLNFWPSLFADHDNLRAVSRIAGLLGVFLFSVLAQIVMNITRKYVGLPMQPLVLFGKPSTKPVLPT